jgi:ATP-binding cassette subfamily B protein
MDLLTDYAKRPVSFLLRYVRQRKLAHGAILFAVVGAVGCSVSTQYGVKFLVDTLSVGLGGNAVWIAFGLLVSLIAADNLLWRLAGWMRAMPSWASPETCAASFFATSRAMRRAIFPSAWQGR